MFAAWLQLFSSYLLGLGFVQSRANSSLFHFHRGASIIYVILYVDNIVVTGNDSTALRHFISRTHHKFAIKDLGQLNYFLGLEVSYTTVCWLVRPSTLMTFSSVLICWTPSPFSLRWPLVNLSLALDLPFRILLCKGLLLGLSSIWPSLDPISPSPTGDHFLVVKCIFHYVKETFHFVLSFTKHNGSSIYRKYITWFFFSIMQTDTTII